MLYLAQRQARGMHAESRAQHPFTVATAVCRDNLTGWEPRRARDGVSKWAMQKTATVSPLPETTMQLHNSMRARNVR